jgi:hypothetical protein
LMRLDWQENSEAFLRMWSRTHLVMIIIGRVLPLLDYAAWRFLLLFSWIKLGLTVELGMFSQTKFWTRQWWASRGDIWDIFVKESWETGTGWSWSFFQKPRSCTHSLPLAGVSRFCKYEPCWKCLMTCSSDLKFLLEAINRDLDYEIWGCMCFL